MKIKPFSSAKEIQKHLDKRGDYGYSADPTSLRILGFIAEQLELLNRPPQKRAPSPWNKFFAAQIKMGRSAREAAEAWKSRKTKGGNK